MSKRKREASLSPSSQAPNAIAGPSTLHQVSPSSVHSSKRRKEHVHKSKSKGKGKAVDGQAGAPFISGGDGHVEIVWELADGSAKYHKRLSRHKSMDEVISKVRRKLHVSLLGGIRLAQVRPDGREVEICDEFDFEAFKKRAQVSNGTLLVKVYSDAPPSLRSHTTPAPVATPTKSSVDKAESKKGKKRVSILLPGEETPSIDSPTPSTPPPVPQISYDAVQITPVPTTLTSDSDPSGSKISGGKGKRKRRKRQSIDGLNDSAPPTSAKSLASIPAPASLGVNRLLSSLDRYKPVRPSPLGRLNNATQNESAVLSPKAEKRRRRKNQSLAGTDVADNNQLPNPEATTPMTPVASVPTPDTTTSVTSPKPIVPAKPESSEKISPSPEKPDSLDALDDPVAPVLSTSADGADDTESSILPPSSPPSIEHAPIAPELPSTPQKLATPHSPAPAPTTIPDELTTPPRSPKIVPSTPRFISLSDHYTPIPKPSAAATPRESSSFDSPTKKSETSKKRKNEKTEKEQEKEGEEELEGLEASDSPPPPRKSRKSKKKAGGEAAVEPAVAADDNASEAVQDGKEEFAPQKLAYPQDDDLEDIETPKRTTSKRSKKAVPKPAEPEEVVNEDVFEVSPADPIHSDTTTTSPPAAIPKKGRKTKAKSAPIISEEPTEQASSIVQFTSSTSDIPIDPSAEIAEPIVDQTLSSSSETPKRGKKPRPAKISDVPSTSKSIMEQYRAKKAAEEAAKAVSAEQSVQLPDSLVLNGDLKVPDAVEEALPEDDVELDFEQQETVQSSNIEEAEVKVPQIAPSIVSETTAEAAEDENLVNGDTPEDLSAMDVDQAESTESIVPTAPAPPVQLPIPKTTRKLDPTKEYAAMAHRVPCIICGEFPSHLQKNCPIVKEGLEALQEVLVVRKKQAEAEAVILETKTAQKKGKKGPSRQKDEEDDGETSFVGAASVEAIQQWIDRETRLRRRITGDTSPGHVEVGLQPDGSFVSNYPGYRTLAEAIVSGHTNGDDAGAQLAATESPTASVFEALREADNRQTPPPLAPAGNAQTPGPIDAPALHLLHQRALARPRRPGSLSGLSASDAVIETNPSDSEDSESDSDSESGSESGTEDDSISGSGSPSVSGSERSHLGSQSPERQQEGDETHLEARDHSPIPITRKVGRSSIKPVDVAAALDSGHADQSDSDSGGSSSDGGDQSETSDTSPAQSLPDDPEASFRHFLSKPLSQRERKRARLSAASMLHSQTIESDQSDVEVDDGEEDEEDEEGAVKRFTRRRSGSESSIGDFGGDDAIEELSVSDAQSDIQPSTISQVVPPVLASSDAERDDSDESKRSTRSFVALDRDAGSSPVVDDLEGSKALRDAIEEDKGPAEILVDETLIDDGRGSHVNEQGLPSPPSSHNEEVIPTQLLDPTPTPRVRGKQVISLAPAAELSQSPPVVPSSQLSWPSQPSQRQTRSRAASAQAPALPTPQTAVPDTAASPVNLRRRLRSVSTDIHVEQSPRRSARLSASVEPASPRVTRSQASLPNSPEVPQRSISQKRDKSGLQLELHDETNVATPTQTTQRRTRARSSQIDESESSQPQQNGVAASVSDDGGSNSTVRRSSRVRYSPLFISQGSQGPLTQKYTTVDSSLPAGTQVRRASSKSEVRQTSPIIEEAEEEEEEEEVETATAEVPVDDEQEENERDEDVHSEHGSGDDGTNASSDEDGTIIPVPMIRPFPRRAASQQPSHPMPTLSSLDTSILRAGRSAGHLNRGTASQPVMKSKTFLQTSESEASSDSSSEDDVPAERKGRYATGRSGRGAKKRSGAVRGW